MRQLADRTAVITGAAGGIGAALARALLAQGCRLALADIDGDGVAALATELGGAPRVTAHQLDVRDREAWRAFAEQVGQEHGGADILINNAGVTVFGTLRDQTDEQVDRVLDVNLRGVVLGCRAFTEQLVERRGHLVNLSSLAALLGIPTQATYSASKYAVRGLTAALRAELAPLGVGVTAVLPGTIATAFLRRAGSHDAAFTDRLAQLMADHGTPPDRLARLVLTGIRWNRAEVVVGWDAHLTSWVAWLAPWLLRAAMAWGSGLMARRGRQP